MPTPRQIAFVKLAKLFQSLDIAVGRIRRDLTSAEQTRASEVLRDNFTMIMDEYDKNKREETR